MPSRQLTDYRTLAALRGHHEEQARLRLSVALSTRRAAKRTYQQLVDELVSLPERLADLLARVGFDPTVTLTAEAYRLRLERERAVAAKAVARAHDAVLVAQAALQEAVRARLAADRLVHDEQETLRDRVEHAENRERDELTLDRHRRRRLDARRKLVVRKAHG